MYLKMNVNDLWSQFLEGEDDMVDMITTQQDNQNKQVDVEHKESLSISTKTMISYLNQPVDIRKVFWELPMIQYHETRIGIIKKQIKWTCETEEEIKKLQQHIDEYSSEIPISVDVLKQSDTGRFKDIRKINIGLCKKDLLSYRSKKKSAFYNCIVAIMRIKDTETTFKEIHVKLFNTGKMEIPGIQNNEILFKTLDTLTYLLNHTSMRHVQYSNNEHDVQTVLINSNFHCGYTVNRQALYERLKFEYGFNALYDPCKYPGVQCKFYYNQGKEVQDGICDCETPCSKKGRPRNAPTGPCLELSFMIFRTGSILIVGHCHEGILRDIYKTISTIMKDEKQYCMIQNMPDGPEKKHVPQKRTRKFKCKLSKKVFETFNPSGLLYPTESIHVPDELPTMSFDTPKHQLVPSTPSMLKKSCIQSQHE